MKQIEILLQHHPLPYTMFTKSCITPLLLLLLSGAGCDLRQREEALQKKEAALNQREQELLLREKTLQVKEDELAKQKQVFDSSMKVDTSHIVNASFVGAWDVKMTCTETTCPGSAVGDTKTEEWSFAYEGTTLVVKATANEQLVRVYTGYYSGNAIELEEEKTTAQPSQARMIIRLRPVDETHLDGQREIVREKDCRVLYALQLQKK